MEVEAHSERPITTGRPVKRLLVLPGELDVQIANFRFSQHIQSQSAAIRRLLLTGLSAAASQPTNEAQR